MTHIKLFRLQITIFSIVLSVITLVLLYLIIYTTQAKYGIAILTVAVIQLVYMLRNKKKFYFKYDNEKVLWFLPSSEEKYEVYYHQIKKITTDWSGVTIHKKDNTSVKCSFDTLKKPDPENIKTFFENLKTQLTHA